MKVLSLTNAIIVGLCAVLLPLAISVPDAQTLSGGCSGHCARAGRHVLGQPDIAWHPVSGRFRPAGRNQEDDPNHSELCGVDGEFPHHREQHAIGDSEE
jgi:hypothetical protein